MANGPPVCDAHPTLAAFIAGAAIEAAPDRGFRRLDRIAREARWTARSRDPFGHFLTSPDPRWRRLPCLASCPNKAGIQISTRTDM
jgi:hypothetical protein